jgi:predicted NAD/FAD-binding protein
MHFDRKQTARAVTACVLVTLFALPTNLLAQAHVVSPADLQKEVVTSSQARQQNLEQVKQFLSSDKAQKAMRSAHLDPVQVTTAASSLSDAELAQMAARSQKAQADFAAGHLSNRNLLLIILGIAALLLIIVLVR